MELGERRTELVHFGDTMPITKTGTVVYIHPDRVFYVVEFDLGGCPVRESYFFPGRRGEMRRVRDR